MDRSAWDEVTRAERAFIETVQRVIEALPGLPEDGWCECGADDEFYWVELGLERWESLACFDGDWEAASRGWDAISDGDSGTEHAYCLRCERRYRIDKEVDWT